MPTNTMFPSPVPHEAAATPPRSPMVRFDVAANGDDVPPALESSGGGTGLFRHYPAFA